MQVPSTRSAISHRHGNLGQAERWLSAALGVGLLLTAARGNSLARIARGLGAASLLTRAATGFCAVKSAVQGDSTFADGVRQQWQQLTETVSSAALPASESAQIESMDEMYAMELQELHSAEVQFCALLNKLVPIIGSAPLAFRIEEYATELQSRKVDLESLLASSELEVRDHPDDAMLALIEETHKMAAVCAPKVRDAALAASVQRIIHYKIAGYGTIASYAKALGKLEQAGHFAQLAERDKAIDVELTDLAKATLNPDATRSLRIEPTPATTH